MPSYILVDVKTQTIVGICSAVTLVLFIIGVLIGYYSAPSNNIGNTSNLDVTVVEAFAAHCSQSKAKTSAAKTYFQRYSERHSEKLACIDDAGSCWDFGLPRTYNVYHLNGKTVTIDGKLDDDAWKEVPWSDNFANILSKVYPAPRFDTKFKLRWDNTKLYIGGYMQETDIYASYTEHDSRLHEENDVEMYMAVDSTMFNYKQIQINALGTMMDQILFKSPHDNGGKLRTWDANFERAVYLEGTMNNSRDVDKFWTVEISIPFQTLSEMANRTNHFPDENEAWFINFSRKEYRLNSTATGGYNKTSIFENWTWQPCDTTNCQLQDRWGLMQFKRNLQDRAFRFEKWHVYKALFDTMDAMKIYKALHSRNVGEVQELDIPPYLMSQTCVDIPEIKYIGIKKKDFMITIKSLLLPNVVGTIRSDRYVTFL